MSTSTITGIRTDSELMTTLETSRRIGEVISLCKGEIPVFADLSVEIQEKVRKIICAPGLDLTDARSLLDSGLDLLYEVERLCPRSGTFLSEENV